MKKVVSATLAGALAVGMVPAMAFAADDAVELQTTATVDDDMSAATIVSYENGLASGHKFTYDGNPQALVPTAVQGSVSDKSYEVTNYKYFLIGNKANTASFAWTKKDTFLEYEKNLGTTAPSAIGKYAVVAYVEDGVVGNTADDSPARYVGTFEIVGKSLAEAEVVQVNDNDTVDGINDAGIVWDGTDKTFDALNGNLTLKVGETLLTDAQFDVVEVYNSKNVKIWDADVDAIGDFPNAAGDYTAVVKGLDANYKDQTAELDYTIQKLDLGKAFITYEKVWEVGTQPSEAGFLINGVSYTDKELDIEHSATATKGPKTATLTVDQSAANAEWAANVEGQAKLDYIVVTAKLSATQLTAQYNEKPFANYKTEGTALQVGAANGKYFDDANVDVQLDGDAFDKSVLVVEKKVNGVYVPSTIEELEAANNAGYYRVTASVDAAAVDYEYAGTNKYAMYVLVDNGDIVPASVAYLYGGVALTTSSLEVDYDGTDVASKLSAVVKTDEGVKLVEGTDYTIEITATVNGKTTVVTEAIDANTYTFTVKSAKYKVDGDPTFQLKIDDAEVEVEFVNDYGVLSAAPDPIIEDSAVRWTGEEINPVEGFWTYDEVAKKYVEMSVPADAYTIKIEDFTPEKGDKPLKTPTVIKDAGWYTLTISDAKTGKDNYEIDGIYDTTATEYILYVTAKSVFVDVPSAKWFAPVVFEMADAGIIGGYGNGKFGPYDNCDREDYAVMIARMLGGVPRLGDSFLGEILKPDGTTGGILNNEIITPFADVDGEAYYAAAVKYVYENDIMGQNVGKVFGVNADITREEAITVLYRIDNEKLYEAGTTLMAGALDAYVDADEVSKWAVEAMNWGVEKGIIGVNTDSLNPGDPISRAEIAALLSRYMELREIA